MKRSLTILSAFFVLAVGLSFSEVISHVITENWVIPSLQLESRNMVGCGHGSWLSKINHFLLLFLPALFAFVLAAMKIKRGQNEKAVISYQLLITILFLVVAFIGVKTCVYKYSMETTSPAFTGDLGMEGYNICQLNWCLWGMVFSAAVFLIVFFIEKMKSRSSK